MLFLINRKTTPERVELTPLSYPEKIKKAMLIKIYIAFEEPLLLHAGKEARPE